MKKAIIIGSVALNAILGVLLFNKSKAESAPMAQTLGPNTSQPVKDRIPSERREKFKNANDDIQRYFDSIVVKYENQRQFVKAYTISAIDMLEVMGLDTNTVVSYDNCRAYLALSANNEFKMYLTPILKGSDHFLNYKSTTATADTNANSYMLDLIVPCPNTCDYKSPADKKKK